MRISVHRERRDGTGTVTQFPRLTSPRARQSHPNSLPLPILEKFGLNVG